MIVRSPAAFAAAVDEHELGGVAFDFVALERAAATVAETGLLLVGEPHGTREAPNAVYALACVLGTRALALEWSHQEWDAPVRAFLREGTFDFEQLWSLPATAEFFSGDGRVSAGVFALLRRLRCESRLEQVIAFDRVDPVPLPPWQARERDLAARLLSEWDRRLPLLVLTGAFHARLDEAAGETMAVLLARELPALQPAMLDFAGGRCWFRGEAHDVSGRPPAAPIVLRIPEATPAIVPGRGD